MDKYMPGIKLGLVLFLVEVVYIMLKVTVSMILYW